MGIGDVPELDMQFIHSADASVALREPATAGAPVIGSALFAAVGVLPSGIANPCPGR